MLRLLKIQLAVFNDVEFFESLEEKERIKLIDCYFIFALIWSVGACLVSGARRAFDLFLRRLLQGDIPEVKKGKTI